MSSILKALRKVEDEKAALGDGGVDLAHDILKRNYDQPQKTNWLLIGTAFVLLLVGIGVGWWLLPQPASVTEGESAVTLEQETVPQSGPAAAAIENATAEVAPPPTAVLSPLSSPPAAVAKKDVSVAPVADQSVEVTAVLPEIALPALNIEEIVFHQDPAARLAVINELPVMVGTDIDGVRVEEILADRVMFSYRGIRFEKLLGEE